ncbi:unnamed protein product, partial [Ectocarpus sp. 8 AP-2014]
GTKRPADSISDAKAGASKGKKIEQGRGRQPSSSGEGTRTATASAALESSAAATTTTPPAAVGAAAKNRETAGADSSPLRGDASSSPSARSHLRVSSRRNDPAPGSFSGEIPKATAAGTRPSSSVPEASAVATPLASSGAVGCGGARASAAAAGGGGGGFDATSSVGAGVGDTSSDS